MKLKISKPAVISIFLLVITLSSMAYGAFQSAQGANSQNKNSVELPSSNIIDYRLTSEQQRYLLRSGKTLIEFEYSLRCQSCSSVKAQAEALTNAVSDQVILSEIVVEDSSSLPIVRIESSYGRDVLTSATSDQMTASLCSLLASPPAWCVRSGI